MTIENPDLRVLTSFLYHLLRDKLPAGEVEILARTAEEVGNRTPSYSNPYVGEYAEEIAHRLMGMCSDDD